MTILLYWGYLHQNGEVILKRYFGEEDLIEADHSPLVIKRTDTFEAETREEAARKLRILLK